MAELAFERTALAREPGRTASALAALAALAGALCFGAAAWMAAPWRRVGAPAVRVLLLDESASVVRTRPDHERRALAWLAREARAAGERGEDVLAVAFGRDVAVLDPGLVPARAALARFDPHRDAGKDARPGRAEGLVDLGFAPDPSGRMQSDLGAALAAAAARCEGRAIASVRVRSDGRWTGNAPENAPESAPGNSAVRDEWLGAARVEWEPVEAAELSDLACERLEVPPVLEVGAPLALRAWLRLERGLRDAGVPLRARVTATLQGSDPDAPRGAAHIGADSGERTRELDVELVDGAQSLALDLGPAPRGRRLLRVRARLLDPRERESGAGDPTAENDTAWAVVRSGSDLDVVVAAAPEWRAAAQAWAQRLAGVAGLSARVVEARELARQGLDAAAWLTIDVAPSELPRLELQAFLERGGGWLACAGARVASADAALLERSAYALAPLDFAAQRPRPRDVLLLLDGSGSMSGAPLESLRAAAAALAASTRAEEGLQLAWFTDELEPTLDLRADPGALARPRGAGGATDIAAALEALARRLEGFAQRGAARATLVFLLTDGREGQRPSTTRVGAPQARARLERAGGRLVVCAAPPYPDLEYLAKLAGSRAQVRDARDPARLEAILREAWSGARCAGPAEGARRAGDSTDGQDLVELGAAFAAATSLPIDRLVCARGRDGAAEVLSVDAPPFESAPEAAPEFAPGSAPDVAPGSAAGSGGDASEADAGTERGVLSWPLLAARRAGLGWVLAFASVPLPSATGGVDEGAGAGEGAGERSADAASGGWAAAWGVDLTPWAAALRVAGRGRGSRDVELVREGDEWVCRDVPPHWPARVVARAVSAGSSGGEVELWARAAVGLDARTQRRGPWRPLGSDPASETAWIEFVDPGEAPGVGLAHGRGVVLARVAVAGQTPSEFAAVASEPSSYAGLPGGLTAGAGVDPEAPRARGEGRGADRNGQAALRRWTLAWSGCGLLLVAIAVLVARGRTKEFQALGRPGR